MAARARACRCYGAEVISTPRPVQGKGFRFANTLLRVSGAQFLRHPQALQTEAFGPVSLLVMSDDPQQTLAIARQLEGSLTGTIYSHYGEIDETYYRDLEPILRQRVGRLLNDKMPTGVTVSPAMQHGGPFPAAGHSGFTAVGIPASIRRFTALQSFDNVRPNRLPVELRDTNPTGRLWRTIDGLWTQADVAQSGES